MIPHNKLTIGDEEGNAALRVLSSGWLAPGIEVTSFENELCAFLGLPESHAVAFSSCSVSLFCALQALGAKGKKVGFPVYVSRVLKGAVNLVGAEELLYDVSKDSPNIDLDAVNLSQPDLLIAPHMFGVPVDLPKIKGIDCIENCAHFLGGKVNGIFSGLSGKIGAFSFQATKLITSGGMGGALISADKEIIDWIRDYRDFDERRDMSTHLNFKMTDIQAAIGREQLKKLPSWIEKREELFQVYKSYGLPLLEATMNCQPIRYRAVLRTKKPREIINKLGQLDIKAIVPIEDWELIGSADSFPNAYELTQTTVSLPIYPTLTNEQARTIARVVEDCI